ncbi:MAG: glutathione S-transferase family protein [Erythrobacter sp.]|nr:glutathione S-transferase family protein [Erythrobacter sp.]
MTHELAVDRVWDVYGSRISYYTGKLECWLRLHGIDYRILPVGGNTGKLIREAGASQMPVVQMTDGRWMSDTTPILAWLDDHRGTGPSIYPDDPALRFVALLIEDYADEWLWRSAMHYRWTYRLDREYALEILYEEQVRHALKVPKFMGKRILKKRQLGGFVKNDGVDDVSRPHADQTYLNGLACMEAILSQRPFLLGDRPTIADYGMMGPMFRHFGQDPTPSEIMRQKGPNVFAWVARMWGLKPSDMEGALIGAVNALLTDFLKEIAETHLAQLRQNAAAWSAGAERYALEVQGTRYASVPTSRYRVWCLETLRAEWAALPAEAQAGLRGARSSPEAALLWDDTAFKPSDYDSDNTAPFNRAINVFDGGVPTKA